ncbi:hypothetical protein M501DRAFT_978400 [Patellaria atrata CBS 101060]|uniref:Uncharacterized protein n=1 Tax=Patellaria atrata CBS 101060 TaxID=1346257 RepID=A0A9P4S7L3_9PEZI|nr:hypothetical protein M501DRAFT_978400 [Patellaria atrata CBS 101060]
MDDIPNYPLYHSTYSTYRLSPLYHGNTPLLDPTTLRTHSRRLLNTLKRDNLRGVHVALGNPLDNLNRTGNLEECIWNLIGDEASWRRARLVEHSTMDEASSAQTHTIPPNDARGIHIELRFEKQTYTSLLLRDPRSTSQTPGFTTLPLLLIRMPTTLRDLFIDYLSTAFDTRIAPMPLRPGFLTSSLENLLHNLSPPSPTETQTTQTLKTLHIQLTFPLLSPALKTLDISLSAADIPPFLSAGRALLSPEPPPSTTSPTPFDLALSHYLRHHLALTLAPNSVTVAKIVCPPLALSAEGKVKLSPSHPPSTETGAGDGDATSESQGAMDEFRTSLIREAERWEYGAGSEKGKRGVAVDAEAGARGTGGFMEAIRGKRGPVGEKDRVDGVDGKRESPPPPYEEVVRG